LEEKKKKTPKKEKMDLSYQGGGEEKITLTVGTKDDT